MRINNKIIETVYISHPYTGNEQENMEKALNIAKKLAKEYPDILFINPLHALEHESGVLDYDTCLNHCLRLLQICDGIIMAGDWQDSRGCKAEKEFAGKEEILDLTDFFLGK